MNYSAAQLKSAARKALEQGNEPMALELGRRAMEQAEREASTKAWTDEMTSTDEGNWENTKVAVGRGMSNVINGATELFHRVTGDDDALARFNARMEEEDKLYERFQKENPVTSAVGNFAGEAAMTLPVGMGAAGLVGKATGIGTKGLTLRQGAGLAAAEGFAADSIATRGDAATRLKAGAISGATGGIVDAHMTKLGRKFAARSARKEFVKDGIADEHSMIQRNIDAAMEDGGYQMDAADASGRETALTMRDKARGLEENDQRVFEAIQERDIAEQANEFADATQGVRRPPEEIADELQETLADERNTDFANAGAAYDKWRDSFGSNIYLDTTGFMSKVDELLDGVKQGQRGIVMNVKQIMKRKGISAEKPLAVEEVEDVIQEINSLYKSGDGPYNRTAGKIKQELDSWVEQSWPDLNDLPQNHPAVLGKRARTQMRKAFEKWDTGDIVDKLTSKSTGSDQFKMKPMDALTALNRTANHKELKKLKMRLLGSGSEQQKQLWADMEAIPVFEAIGRALPDHSPASMAEGGQEVFNSKAFANSIGKLSRSTRETLWGPEGADAMERAIASWSKRGRRIDTRANPNKSGTARAAAQSAVRAAGGKVLTILPFIADVAEKVNQRAIRKGGEALRAGKLDKGSIEQLTAELRQEFSETYKNAATEYGYVFDYLAREVAREMTDEDE